MACRRHFNYQSCLVAPATLKIEGLKEDNILRRYLYIVFSLVFILTIYLPGQAMAGKITGIVKVNGLRSPADILVYVVKAPSVHEDLSKTKFTMDQQNLTFIPHVLPIPVGASVNFPNNDKVDHNIFSLSRTKKFNLGSYKPGEHKSVLFDKPGIVELRCDVHAEMAAFIMVLKNPYFAVTDDQGRFEIPSSKYLEQNNIKNVKDLPPGQYVLKIWHEKLKTQKQIVTVPENGDVSIEITATRGIPGVLYK
jgi:plastocyanin